MTGPGRRSAGRPGAHGKLPDTAGALRRIALCWPKSATRIADGVGASRGTGTVKIIGVALEVGKTVVDDQ